MRVMFFIANCKYSAVHCDTGLHSYRGGQLKGDCRHGGPTRQCVLQSAGLDIESHTFSFCQRRHDDITGLCLHVGLLLCRVFAECRWPTDWHLQKS